MKKAFSLFCALLWLSLAGAASAQPVNTVPAAATDTLVIAWDRVGSPVRPVV